MNRAGFVSAAQSRRKFLFRACGGFFGTALGGVLAEDGQIPGAMSGPHLPPKAKSVILLFMCGGVSHIDTFDPKDNKWAGKLIDAIGFGDNLAEMKRPVIPCHRVFKPRGQSGIEVSDWFPHLGEVMDDVALIRSMWCQESNHFPAVVEMATLHRNRLLEHPSFGSWVTYALGSVNRNLPAFVNIGRPTSPVQLSAGYLGAKYSATPFQSSGVPVRNLDTPQGTSREARERQMETLEEMNREFRARHAVESDIAARIRAYELAARMQMAAPEAADFSREPESVRRLYGLGEGETDDFGRQLLLARRLAERGVRFIQVCHAGGGNGAWDAHGDIATHAPLCRQTDKPIAGLLRDLKQRGMLDQTLVVWTSEFGRTPWSQNTTGRDHNPRGFSSWIAGGGTRGGVVHGSTDEVGYLAVEKKVYIGDLHATVLKQMGLNPSRMEVVVQGRPVRFIEDEAFPVDALLKG